MGCFSDLFFSISVMETYGVFFVCESSVLPHCLKSSSVLGVFVFCFSVENHVQHG